MTLNTLSPMPHGQVDPDLALGRIVSVSGSQAVVLLHAPDDKGEDTFMPAEMGTLVKIITPRSTVLGLVSALTVPVPSHNPSEPEMKIIELEFVGELPCDESGNLDRFRRGISNYPSLGDQVYHVNNDILALAYAHDEANGIRLGTIVQEPTIPAMARMDEILGKHLSILGSTGTGKSCSVALLLRNILEKTPNAHLVLLDPHREYQPAFKGLAEVVTSENLNLPFWLLNFEEIVEILIGNQADHEADIETLRELIPVAKARYGANQRRGDLRAMLSRPENEAAAPSIDTPVPYRISDLIALLDEHIGKLDLRRSELVPFKRLKARLESISRDPRYAFMFGNLTVQDTMADILGRIFRVPVEGKPITIFELAGLPSEIINVVVSVLSRMAFDFAMWSRGKVPITLVCEESHRYAPADSTLGFEPAKRALSKIAKEGRKYGISLVVVSQRPAELDPTILSQCATIVCMRLTNERDQGIARARVSDGSASLLDSLPSLATGEAVVFGEGVALPTRIRFDRLPENAMPRSSTASFSQDWQSEVGDAAFLHDVVNRWRAQSLGPQVDNTTHMENGVVAGAPSEPEADETPPLPDEFSALAVHIDANHQTEQPVQPSGQAAEVPVEQNPAVRPAQQQRQAFGTRVETSAQVPKAPIPAAQEMTALEAAKAAIARNRNEDAAERHTDGQSGAENRQAGGSLPYRPTV